MKVLYLVSRLGSSGPTTQLRYIIENLGQTFSPVILTLSPEREKTDRPIFEEKGIQIYSLNLSRYSGLLGGAVRLRRLCRDISPDVVHSQGVRPDLMSSIFLGKYNRVSTLRNYAYEDFPAKYGIVKGGITAIIHIFASSQIDVCVACSNALKNKVLKHGVNARVVQNGVDIDKYRPPDSEKSKSEIRKSLDIPSGKTVFVSVGSFISRKDPKTVIRAFKESNASKSCVLVMLGDGPLLESCRKEVEEEDIRIPGYVENVDSYLRAADFFLSASHSEGLPNTVMEALATGLPAVLSNIEAHREILERSVELCHFFEPGDSSGMSEAIDSILDMDRGRLRQKARSLIKTQFTAHRTSERYQSIYKDVV